MDTFIDKIASKFSAQEIIKANSEAEEKELQRLKSQLAEYDERLQEIRKLNLKNLEIADKLQEMLEAEKGADTDTIEAVHKECVKVYRNVQAVVEQGLQEQTAKIMEQTELIGKQNETIRKKVRGIKPIMILTLLLSAGNLAVVILKILEII